jgi:hypothetical protein
MRGGPPAWSDGAAAVHVAPAGPGQATIRRVADVRACGGGGCFPRPVDTAAGEGAATAYGPGIVELEIDGVVVRVGEGARAATVAAVIRALRASS